MLIIARICNFVYWRTSTLFTRFTFSFLALGPGIISWNTLSIFDIFFWGQIRRCLTWVWTFPLEPFGLASLDPIILSGYNAPSHCFSTFLSAVFGQAGAFSRCWLSAWLFQT